MANIVFNGSAGYPDGATSFVVPNVETQAGDYIFVIVNNDHRGAVSNLSVAWNSVAFTSPFTEEVAFTQPTDPFNRTSFFGLKVVTGGTADVVCTLSEYRTGSIAVVVGRNLDSTTPILMPTKQQVWSPYTAPSLTLTSIGSTDVPFSALVTAGWDSDYTSRVGTTWTAGAGQTSLADVGANDVWTGRLNVSSKVSGSVTTFTYSPSADTQAYSHFGFIFKGVEPAPRTTLAASVQNRINNATDNGGSTATGVQGATAVEARLSWGRRFHHTFGSGNLDKFRLIYNNWRGEASNNQEFNTGNSYTVTAGHVDFNGVLVPILFNGSRTITIADGANEIFSDWIYPAQFGLTEFVRGDTFWTKEHGTVPGPTPATNGKLPTSYRQTADFAGSQMFFYAAGQTTISSIDVAGMFTSTGALRYDRASAAPPLVIGTYIGGDKPVRMAIGDSMTQGTGDGTAFKHGRGSFQRAMVDADGSSNPYSSINFAVHGSAAPLAVQGTKMRGYAKYVNSVMINYGTNDFSLSGDSISVSGMVTRINSIRTAYTVINSTLRWGVHALGPRNTSTDAWATLVNQTTRTNWGAGGNPDLYNQGLSSTGYDVVFPNTAVRSSIDYHKFEANGTANLMAFDDTHYSTNGYTVTANQDRPLFATLDPVLESDTTPNAFTFTAQTGAVVSTPTTSNTITVSGINAAAAISISGGSGTYSKNGGAYVSTAGTVVAGDTVSVRVTSSGSASTPVTTTLTIGGVNGVFSVTTASAGATITAVNGSNPISAGQTNVSITTSGLSTLTGITIGGVACTNIAGSGDNWTFTAPNWVDGSTIPNFGANNVIATDGTLTTPAFSKVFAQRTNQGIQQLTSVPATSIGYIGYYTGGLNAAVNDHVVFDLPATLATASGQTVVDNGVDVDGRIHTDYTGAQSMWLRRASTGIAVVLTVTTASASDTTPDPFTFTSQTSVAISSPITSNTITVAGINSPAAISITGGTYSINGGAYISTASTVSVGNTVSVRLTSSASFNTATSTTLTIGGVTGTFTATTRVVDTVPNPLIFPTVTGTTVNTVTTSSAAVVSGIDAGQSIPITITGGTYSKNGGAYTNSAGTVILGDSITVRVTSSIAENTLVSATVTINGVNGVFNVITQGSASSVIPLIKRRFITGEYI